jgi:NTP pyrophosphatase (non-canonical NTP hydrolase)
VTSSTYLVLSDLTLSAIQAEATRAHLKHREHSMFGTRYTAHERLAILIEEVGEVAHELTYDQDGDRDKLVKELIQVCAMAASWVEYLEGAAAQARRQQAGEGITGLHWDNLGSGGAQ